MSAETAFAVRSWQVGPYTCEMTVRRTRPSAVVNAVCAWSPNEPARLTTAEWRQYRAGRDHALGEIAAALGLNVGVLEL